MAISIWATTWENVPSDKILTFIWKKNISKVSYFLFDRIIQIIMRDMVHLLYVP